MSRDTRQLHPHLQAVIPEFLRKCRAAGLEVRVTDCFRTKAEQQAIYAQGRTKPGTIVTSCTYPYSPHNWGVAFDFCRNDGKGAYYNNDGFFEKVGRIGESMGLQWGGDWRDQPHLQLAEFFTEANQTTYLLRNKYANNPEAFFKTWGSNTVKENWGNLSMSQLTAMLAGQVAGNPTTSDPQPATGATGNYKGKVNADGQRGTTPKLLYTGIYDARVKELQKKMGNVAVDGIAGPETYNALVAGGYSVNAGDEDWFVEWVQKRLTDLGYNPGVIDGIAGNRTMAAVHAFQTDYGTGASNLNGIDLYYIIES